MKNSWTAKAKWILWLKNNGYIPIIEILDECDENTDIYELEIYWISQFKTWGYKLKNETDGGDRGPDLKGIKLTKEHILKMSTNHPLRKEICQYKIKNDELINEFFSSHEASKKTGFIRKHIINCCKGKKNCNSVGIDYYFRFKDNYFPYLKASNRPKVEILKYDSNNNLLKKYKSGYELKKCDNIDYRTILKNYKGSEKILYNNFYWVIK